MTKTFKIRDGKLVAEFFTHTQVVVGFLNSAGAITLFTL